MANTVIALKKSATPTAIPSSLANGELALNYADGKLYYKAANGTIAVFSSGEAGDSFGTVNAAGTLIVADTSGDILTLEAGTNVTITGDAVNDKITISATSSGGGGYFDGNNGEVGSSSGLGDIFRVHTNTLTSNVTIYSGNNALAAGPITVAENRSLTIQANARVSIV
jgi:hypothetical protein